MPSEATIEQAVYQDLFFYPGSGFQRDRAEFQAVHNPEISPYLKSKGGDGRGKPEMVYILGPNDILVLEVKPNLRHHSSVPGNVPVGVLQSLPSKAKEMAEDGVIHYMLGLKREFNVIGVAISPTSTGWMVSNFRAVKGGKIEKLRNSKILTASEYSALLDELFTPKETPAEIQEFSVELHNYLRSTMKLSDADKPLLVAGCLVALSWRSFYRDFQGLEDAELTERTLDAIRLALRASAQDEDSRDDDVETMMVVYNSVFRKEAVTLGLRQVLTGLKRNIAPNSLSEHNFDLLGNFYGEFLKYSGGDKKGLGIVLTPPHITSLFAQLADLDENSIVLDTCTGTGGFLIAAMANLAQKVSPEKFKEMRNSNFFGIEYNESNFCISRANMRLRGCAKSKIKRGSCFDERFNNIGANGVGRPNVTFLNPPYSQDKDENTKNESELDFIVRACQLTAPGGKVFAIVPMSVVSGQNVSQVAKRAELLKNNTLNSVISMPDQIFPGVGTITVIICLTAGKRHTNEQRTMFFNWKDDGFRAFKGSRREKTAWYNCEKLPLEEVALVSNPEKKAALAVNGGWVYPAGSRLPLEDMSWISEPARVVNGRTIVEGREAAWVRDYRNMESKPGYSSRVCLGEIAAAEECSIAELEWCVEAHLEPDFSELDKDLKDVVSVFGHRQRALQEK